MIVFTLPPSVPPARSMRSGQISSICLISEWVISYEKWPTIFAPAPRAARLAASELSSGTKPTETTRNPPAALLQAMASFALMLPISFSTLPKAFLRPMVTSSSTVEGDSTLETTSSFSKSIATTLVNVLPMSIKSITLSIILMISLSLFPNDTPYLPRMNGDEVPLLYIIISPSNMIKIIVKTLIIFYRISNKDFKEKEKERTNREGYKRVWLDRAKNTDERAKA